MQTKIIAIANQKGGVGKTTTAINISTAIAATKKKVLLIDLDPQGNASTGLGIDTRNNTIYNSLVGDSDITDAIIPSNVPMLDVIAANMDLSGAEIELAPLEEREFILKRQIEKLEAQYDYIFIDCPPSLGLLTLNALVAAENVIIPMQCEFFALEGLSHLLNTIKLIQKRLNTNLSINGVVFTMYDKRNNLTEQVASDVKSCLGQHVYNTVIPRNIRVSEAPSYGKPVLVYDVNCQGSTAYAHLAREMLQRETTRCVNYA